MQIDGGCYRGKITYTAEVDPEKVGICHCTDYQTLSGAAFRVSVAATRENFQLKGPVKVYVKTAESGAKRAQGFCADCGTPIYATAADNPQVYNIRLGAARQRDVLKPKAQGWYRSARSWINDLASIPRFEKQRNG
jgi:hypothetical protein